MSDEAPSSSPAKWQDLVGGCLAVAFGVGTLITSTSYPMGTLLRMGPGFFPAILSVLIIALGLVLVASGVRSRVRKAEITLNYRPLLAIGAGVVLFTLLLTRAGLVPAVLVLVLVSTLAEPKWRPVRAGILALCVTAFVYVVFVVVLQTPVDAVRF